MDAITFTRKDDARIEIVTNRTHTTLCYSEAIDAAEELAKAILEESFSGTPFTPGETDVKRQMVLTEAKVKAIAFCQKMVDIYIPPNSEIADIIRCATSIGFSAAESIAQRDENK